MYIVLTLSVTRVKIWNSTKGEECNPQCSCFTSLYSLIERLANSPIFTAQIAQMKCHCNPFTFTFWMEYSKLEEHPW